MTHRTLMSLVIFSSLGAGALAQAAPSREARVPAVDAAQPLCGGNGTKTPPDGPPAPPKDPPKT